MTHMLARVLAVSGLALCLLVLPAPSQAALQGGVYLVTASKQVFRNGESYDSLAVACPSGTTPAWGGYYDSLGDDIRLIDETFGFGNGASYTVDIVDYSNNGIYGYTTLTVQATCISTSNFTNSKTVVVNAGVDSGTNLALGIADCGSGWLALAPSVYFNSLDTAVLTSSPYNSTTRYWIARGWIGTAGKTMTMAVHCVQSSILDSLRVYSNTDAVSWGSGASATCPGGFTLLTGGTFQNTGDGQAITIDPQVVNRTLQSRSLSLTAGSMVTTVVCLPTTPPQLSLTGTPTPDLNSTTARWDFTVTDPAAAGGYGVSTTCSLQDIAAGWTYVYQNQPCTSPVMYGPAAEGGYLLSVTATTSDGRTNYTISEVNIDHTTPVVTFADAANLAHKTTTVNVSAQVSDNLSLVTSLTCALDGAAAAPCGQSQYGASGSDPGCSNGCAYFTGTQHFDYTDLADGAHVLHVTVTDSHTNTHTYDLPFKVDTVAPSVQETAPTAPFTIATSAVVKWIGTDAVSGVAEYGVRWQKAAYNTDFGAWSTPVVSAPSATSRSFASLARGTTYCYGVNATDKAGNVAPFTPSRCTAIPLDDRDLADSAAWTPVSPAGYFRGTALSTKKFGATLAATGATVKRIAVVAKKCPTCGTIGVYVGSTLISKVNLKAATTSRAVIGLPAFALKTGTVKIKVLTSGKLVQIDALGLSRV